MSVLKHLVIIKTDNGFKCSEMPRTRKRHHSRSRSRSVSRERSYNKQKKNTSNEKDGKRRRLEGIESPLYKRSLSSEDSPAPTTENEVEDVETLKNIEDTDVGAKEVQSANSIVQTSDDKVPVNEDTNTIEQENCDPPNLENDIEMKSDIEDNDNTVEENDDSQIEDKVEDKSIIIEEHEKSNLQELDNEVDVKSVEHENKSVTKVNIDKVDNRKMITTPKKALTPKQLQKKLESEKKREQKQKEREEREKQKQAERQKIKEQKEAERLKQLEMKQKEKEIKEEAKKKEKEIKEEAKKKEKEEKEQKRKEKEEQEEQKRKEKELEKQKKQQEIEEKNKEKQKEEEKKQKTAALFVNFFKKPESIIKEKKVEKPTQCVFMPFEVKADMRLPPTRKILSKDSLEKLDEFVRNQDNTASYLNDIKSETFQPGKTSKTWPYEEVDDDIVIVEEDKTLGQTICGDTSNVQKLKAKFLYFHENRRPAYFGTWRKKSAVIRPRRPFEEDTSHFNYEEDSDDDWEEEEQGESLDVSGDEEDKDAENDKDDYEVDNDFFVPHGHLSDDEIDDEENAKLSPESLKQKLKLLKDEFDEDMKSKTHKLKPRSIGCIWLNKKGDNVEEAVLKYLQPFAAIFKGQIEIKPRKEIFSSPDKKKSKPVQELPPEQIPIFLNIIHGNANNKNALVEQFLTYMANNGTKVEMSKISLKRFLKHTATYRKCTENGPMKNKFGWFVNEDVKNHYNVTLDLLAKEEK
ncbi:chromatin assembly factor 1 subunit A-like isoform X2 [Sitophilus oryzae]|uniref:Chromatin assembly factor 1 subunit A-like isoform X2 n=1 Tax=Sitophilus oryzae TaxID=7048 RepID=A0A6J2XU31_SITOR|nr:chromatin assembly factor 1 subunit A-like isoform X2 [Sitophilus oryzae]